MDWRVFGAESSGKVASGLAHSKKGERTGLKTGHYNGKTDKGKKENDMKLLFHRDDGCAERLASIDR
jgi:hypothetical protein